MSIEDREKSVNNVIKDAKLGDTYHLEHAMSEINQYMRWNPTEADQYAKTLMEKASEAHVVSDLVRTAFSHDELKNKLDLDGDGKSTPEEIERVRSTDHLRQRLTPLQQASLGYLQEHSQGAPVTQQTLDDLCRRSHFANAAERYGIRTFIERADAPGPGGAPDGKLSDAELKAEQAMSEQKLRTAEPGELSQEVRQKYEDRQVISNFLLGLPERPLSHYDIDNAVYSVRSRNNPDSITAETISFRTPVKWGSVDVGRNGYMSDLMRDYLTADNNARFKKLDLDGNGQISRHELDALRASASATTREHDLSYEMKALLPENFTINDVENYARIERQKREQGKMAEETKDYFAGSRHSLDVNGDRAVTLADLRRVREAAHERLATDNLSVTERGSIDTRIKIADFVQNLMETHGKATATQQEIDAWICEKISLSNGASRYMDQDWNILKPDQIRSYERGKAEREEAERARKLETETQLTDYSSALQASEQDKRPVIVLIGDPSAINMQEIRAASEKNNAHYVSLNRSTAMQIAERDFKNWLGPDLSGAVVFKHSGNNGLRFAKALPGYPTATEVNEAIK